MARRNNTKVTLEAREKGLRAKAAAAADAVASKMEGGAARAGSPRKRK